MEISTSTFSLVSTLNWDTVEHGRLLAQLMSYLCSTRSKIVMLTFNYHSVSLKTLGAPGEAFGQPIPIY